jgi:uncharacterized protein YcnI
LKRISALGAAAAGALVLAGGAMAHAEISPPVTVSKHLQLFTLAVPTEKEDVTTTGIELTVPDGFGIDSFVPTPGWTRTVQATGSGEEAVVQKVVWTGGSTPTEEDSVFQFLASPDSSESYSLPVRQTYSDGSVVDWSGSESSDTPVPVVEAKSSLGGGGTSTVTWIALVLGAAGIVIGLIALVGRGGKRELA